MALRELESGVGPGERHPRTPVEGFIPTRFRPLVRMRYGDEGPQESAEGPDLDLRFQPCNVLWRGRVVCRISEALEGKV